MKVKIENSKMFANQVIKLSELLEINKTIEKLAEKAYNSGIMDTEDIIHGDYMHAKAVLSAILEHLARSINPLSNEGEKIKKNLQHLI